jgi:ABC-2 type transport system ATP-binding protein
MRLGCEQPSAVAMSAGIKLERVVKAFRTREGPMQAVRGVDLTVAGGETVALLGPSGAGKSTTVDLMLGLIRPDSGSVSLFDRSPRQALEAGLVGAMIQRDGDKRFGKWLMRDLSVREQIAMKASLFADPMDVGEVISLAGLTEVAGLPTQKLSDGQMQRVRFAVALVSDPELLVLDEPTVSMDAEGRRDFWSAIRGYAAQGKTVIFATHLLEEAEANSERTVLMDRGRIIADAPTAEIKAQANTKRIRATLPDADIVDLARLPGVSSAERNGEVVILASFDSNLAIRALLDRYPSARDFEITSTGLEQSLLDLASQSPPRERKGGTP